MDKMRIKCAKLDTKLGKFGLNFVHMVASIQVLC